MAIEKSENEVLELNAITKIEDAENSNDDAKKIQYIRSRETICVKDTKRSVIFLREHTFLRRQSAMMTCPNCLRAVKTIVERPNTVITHLSALLLLPVCLCFLPYWTNMLRDSLHRCPSCGVYLGAYFASMNEAFVQCCDKRQRSDVQYL